MLADVDSEEVERTTDSDDESTPVQPCPVCGFEMIAVRGSKDAVCGKCGFRDSCCY